MYRRTFINLRIISRSRSASNKSTIDASEVEHFQQFTKEWWNQMGHMKALHAMNKLRVPLIRNGVVSTMHLPKEVVDSPKPLKGISILDVGCGGGILTECLARIGANMKGLDPNCEIVEKAKIHAKENIQYVCSSVEDHAKEFTEQYDVVVASEILEHVTQKEEFLDACIKCLKPGGSFFVTTINKTLLSNIMGIVLAEDLFHVLPKGTHDFNKFIEPIKLQSLLEDRSCQTVLIHGIGYNFVQNDWFWTSNSDINYALHAVKKSVK